MSDWLAAALAEYASGPVNGMSAEVIREAQRRVLDSVGVAIGALSADGPTAVRRLAAETPVAGGARVWGATATSSLEMAAMANGAAVRYLDYNDAYFGIDSAHPSDIIAGLVAVAERVGSSGRDLLEAIALGYEVAVTAADGFGARRRGWDHVNGTALGAVCGAGRLMGLPTDRLRDAIAITVVSHAAMGQSREGELSMWKGLAAPDAVRHALFACRLAAAGVRGPNEPFLGSRGFVKVVLGGELADTGAFDGLRSGRAPRRILDTHIKAWPLGIVAQSGVDAALRLHDRLDSAVDDIEAIDVETFSVAVEVMGSPEKWRPATRETADHSMAYVVTTALRDGRIDASSFTLDKVRDPDTHAFLGQRVRMREDPALTLGYPDGFPTRVTVRTRSGQTLTEEVTHPRGHARNPLDDAGLEAKFRSLAEPVLGDAASTALLELLRNLEHAPDVRGIGDALAAA